MAHHSLLTLEITLQCNEICLIIETVYYVIEDAVDDTLICFFQKYPEISDQQRIHIFPFDFTNTES